MTAFEVSSLDIWDDFEGDVWLLTRERSIIIIIVDKHHHHPLLPHPSSSFRIGKRIVRGFWSFRGMRIRPSTAWVEPARFRHEMSISRNARKSLWRVQQISTWRDPILIRSSKLRYDIFSMPADERTPRNKHPREKFFIEIRAILVPFYEHGPSALESNSWKLETRWLRDCVTMRHSLRQKGERKKILNMA